ncbi:unnamed protein product [Triticum turgidum subsp. durum]|uniref:Uncharacterized protein n=1 Tax=Triticum turgidum subsp. durum TaxID=4567 RepID=A0A9R1BSF4_TRITD|nr:unnamed protein product [Triticum turgidum subsp. durum]
MDGLVYPLVWACLRFSHSARLRSNRPGRPAEQRPGYGWDLSPVIGIVAVFVTSGAICRYRMFLVLCSMPVWLSFPDGSIATIIYEDDVRIPHNASYKNKV